MPRANRFFIPGYIYHITHRCHDRKFLLKFDKDKDTHPCDWAFGGYHEIRKPKERYWLIDHESLLRMSGFSDMPSVIDRVDHEIKLRLEGEKDETDWSKSIAVGEEGFIKIFKEKLLSLGEPRNFVSGYKEETFTLKENKKIYGNSSFASNLIPWEDSLEPTF